ncbi:MAG TPA: hypothetical protein VGU25_12450 [Acidobacteriaceae bacterium]|nr:hypothetical protein [Acidobacteriaceae bacterium]
MVHGGNFPVTGAQIYLFAAGQGGYGTSATSLITSGASGVSCSNAAVAGACYVTTDSGGNFTLTPDYTCTEGQQVYLVGVGGNPGLTGTVNNTSIVQMAALGTCPASDSLSSVVPYVTLNEVTTVAFAYAMSGFATTPYNVSSDAGGETALANALANAGNIVNLGNGVARGVAAGNSNSVLPYAKINTLANILATCVNTQPNPSTGAPSGSCSSLFSAATNSSGAAATDEASAIFNIAHNQAQNVTSIFNLGGSTGPFSPTLNTAPADWTIPVIYNKVISAPSTNVNGTAIIGGPYNVVFDASGNAWIGDRINGVIEINPQGTTTTFSNAANGFNMVKGVAVSPQDGTLWITDYGKNQVDVMRPTGTSLTPVATIVTHLANNGPILTAFASNPAGGNYLAYEATETTTGISAYDAGTYTGSHYTSTTDGNDDYSGINTPGWISVDNAGDVWIPSNNTNFLGELTVSDKLGTMKYPPFQISGVQSYTTAADGLGNVWLATNTTTEPTIYYATEGAYQSAGSLGGSYTGGGINEPYKMVIDGSNTVWIANYGANTVSALNVSGGASKGTWLSPNGFSTGAPGITTTGTYSANSTTVTVASFTGISVGGVVTGTGIPSGTTVSSISGSVVTLSQATTGAGTNAPVTFGSTSCVVIGIDPSGNVWTGNSDESVTELLGLATPAVAPFYGGNTTLTVVGTKNVVTVTKGNLGTRP